ncbi:MAG: hypothetical protein NDF54_03700 [archaeon GB-1867-035]|nr:hypothetical protein [Candidatus Culexmicrobium profundum]
MKRDLAVIFLTFLIAFGLAYLSYSAGFHFPSQRRVINFKIINETGTGKLFKIRLESENTTHVVIVVGEALGVERMRNFVELNPEDYRYTILHLNDSVYVFGWVEIEDLPPRSWYYVKVNFPVKFSVEPYVILTGALRYGETCHLESPDDYEVNPVHNDYFWCIMYTTDDGRIAFTFMAVAPSS